MQRITNTLFLFATFALLAVGNAAGPQKEQKDYSDFDQLLGDWSVTCHLRFPGGGHGVDTFRLVASRNGPIIRFVNPGPVLGDLKDLEWMTGTIKGTKISDIKWSETYPREAQQTPEEANCPLHAAVHVDVIDPAKQIRVEHPKIIETRGRSCKLKEDPDYGPCVLTRP